MKKSIFLTVLLAAFFVSAAIADPGDTLWTRTYGGTGTDQGFSVQQTTDGGYIVAGYTTSYGAGSWDAYLIKTDALGNTLWTQTYGTDTYDYVRSVQQTTDGGYILAGFTQSYGAAGYYDVWLIKTDDSGNEQWHQIYGGESVDYCESVRQTTDGGYIIVGRTASFGAGGVDIYLIKTDVLGNELWYQTFGGSSHEYGFGVQQTDDGGYIVVGYTQSYGGGNKDLYLIKTDTLGDTLWTRAYGGIHLDHGYSVQQTTDGGYIVGGKTMFSTSTMADVWLIKTDASGDTLWTRTWGGSHVDVGYSVQQTTDGGYIISGCTTSFGAGSYDVYLIKTDGQGNEEWTRTYGGIDDEEGWSVQQTTDGGYIIAGETRSFGAGGEDVWLLKVAGEAPEPDVSIEIVPDDPPVTVPQGGTFGFTGTLTNNTDEPQVTDAWIMAIGPQKETYGPFKEFSDVELDPYEIRSRHLNQCVPNLAPLGFYTYVAYCGDYPSTVMDSSLFQVEVIEGQFTEAGEAGWVLTGSFSEGETNLPSEFALLSNYPNPFNAQTVISYQLPSAGEIKLEVYNLLGSKVATLVDNHQEAGYRSITWDASEVSSGIYFYKLTAGDYTETMRMMLVK